MGKDIANKEDGLKDLDLGAPGDSLSDLWSPDDDENVVMPLSDLGVILQQTGAISDAQLANAKSIVARNPSRRVADVYHELGIDSVAIQKAVARVADMEFEHVGTLDDVETLLIKRLTPEYCKANRVLPLRKLGNRVVVGVVDPDNLLIVDEIRHRLGMPVKPVVICPDELNTLLSSLQEAPADAAAQAEQVDDIIAGIEEDDVEVVNAKEEDLDLERMAGESPVIRFVNYLIFNAVKEGASDIHVEPHEKKLQIRYRIDGILFEAMTPPISMHPAIISRLKVMSNLDISERRLPQDGRIRAMVHGRKLDLRLSTLPTAAGEKAVMRILDTKSIQVSLDDLGMGEDALLIWKHQISQPHGIILVTGPTGSGKTTTLYSSLGQMDKARLNISTVEDPVEYHLDGINQTQAHERIGMTFAVALRALLRQDPDVVMVGEIRDTETGRIAIQASLTGHLVLSTLHTNDAPSSITRLINIGVEPYLIGASVNACLAQRLVRRICEHCKEQVRPSETIVDNLAMHGISEDMIYVGKGCEKCRHTGYSGRVGLYELLVLDDSLRDRIASNPNVTEFRRICIERGMVTLREDGFRKVAQGRTTVDEVLRVTEATI
jgi:type IV pilus assembly protein PilB